MNISLDREDYRYLSKCCEIALEECVEAELSLPEYMPEIQRIVKSTAVPRIESQKTVGERVTVDGSCELRMIYTAGDGCLYSFSQTKSFTRYCENPLFANDSDVRIKASVGYVNCRATNTKRAEIKAGISLTVTAFAANNESIVSLGSSTGIEEKCVPVSALSLGCRNSRVFMMSDVFDADREAAFLISATAAAVVGETRKISNKVMIKGEATVEVAYVPASDKMTVEHARFTMPINQILEFDGMEEKFTGDVTLAVTSKDVIIKTDSSSSESKFDVSLGVTATVTMWEEKELFVITDAYSVESSLELSSSLLKFYGALDEIRDTYVYKNTLDFSGDDIGEVLDLTCDDSEPTVLYKDGVLKISGTFKFSLIYRNAEKTLVTAEKMADYCYEKKAEYDTENVMCVPSVTVCSADCAVSGAKSVDVRAELQIICTVLSETELEAVTEITENETAVKERRSAMTVYFPEKEESLWGIARRYNATVSAIADENGLDGETTGEMKILFIPSL